MPIDSPLARKKSLSPKDFDNVPFIAMGSDHMAFHRVREAFFAAESRLNIRGHVHLFRTALDFVKRGMGAAFVDPFTLAEDDGAGYVSQPFKVAVHPCGAS